MGVQRRNILMLFTPILSFPLRGGRDVLFWHLFKGSLKDFILYLF